ncbi:MAG: RNA-guided endonuclease InsQ/TnpB family protein [Sulfuricella sp.]|jgi:putative transposase
MKRMQGYQFRLMPKPEQAEHLNQSLGANRFVWNKLLAMNLFRLEHRQPLLWYQEMAWWIALWKQSEEYGFLSDAPAQSLQQTAKALDRAFKDAFDKNQPNKRIPNFKRLGKNEAGIRYPQGFTLDQGNSVIRLPKARWVKYRNSRPIEGTVKNITISRKAGKYTVSVQTEREVEHPYHPATSAVGVDVGIARFATLSDGTEIDPINSFKKLAKKLATAQRRLKHKTKFSANWQKQKHRINRIHGTIAHVRTDFLHKTSTDISKNHAMIVIEDLKVSAMSRSARGTVDQPGSRVRQKSGLNRSILDQGWGEFRRQLEYKQNWLGGWVMAVPAHHTSQTCPCCGHISKENRLTQSSFVCVECGFAENADLVGALNILERGMQILSSDKNRGTHGDRLPSELPSPHGRRWSATGTIPIKPIPA